MALSKIAGLFDDPRKIELTRDLVEGHYFLSFIRRRPAQKREIIGQSFRQISLAPEFLDRSRAVPLAQLLSVGTEDCRQMGELRDRCAQGLIDKDLPVRVRQMAVAPDDMRNLHQEVVDHAAEIVGRAAVAAQKHRIADLDGLDFDSAENEIGKSDVSRSDPQSQRKRSSRI